MLGVLGAVVGCTVTFVVAAAAGVVLHLDTPGARRLVATQVSRALDAQIQGSVEIVRIGHLGLDGVSSVELRVRDPRGVQVAHASGVAARVETIDLARSALFERGPIRVTLPTARVEQLDVDVGAGPSGDLRLAEAVAPSHPEPHPEPEPEPTEAGRGVDLSAPEITLGHAWAHGTPPGAPRVDADVTGLRARAHVSPNALRADVDRVDVTARGLPNGANPSGTLAAHYAEPSPDGEERAASVTFDGSVGGVPLALKATLDGEEVDGRLDVDRAPADRLRALTGDVPIRREAALHAEVHGVLPRLRVGAHVVAGEGTIDLDSVVTTEPAMDIDARLQARDVDLGGLVGGLPRSDLGLDARGSVAFGDAGVEAKIALDTLPGRLAGQRVPRIALRASYAKDRARAMARIFDRIAPTALSVTLDTRGDRRVVAGELRSRVPELADLPALPEIVALRGSAAIEARGSLDLATKRLRGDVALEGRRIAHEADSVARARAHVRATGTLDRPVLDAELHASGVRAGGVEARSVDARARVRSRGDHLDVEDGRVDLVRDGVEVVARADRVRLGGRAFAVEGAVVEGLGDPIRADVRRDARALRVAVDAPCVDLAKVARVAGRPDQVRWGLATVRGDVTLRRREARGELHVSVEHLFTPEVDDAGLTLDLGLGGRAMDVAARVDLDGVGHVRLRSTGIELGGSPLEPDSWREARGRLELDADVDLAKLARALPPGALPVSELEGRLVAEGSVSRPDGQGVPSLRLSARTLGLAFAGRSVEPAERIGRTRVTGPAPFRSAGLDAQLDARLDPPSGFSELSVRLVDTRGIVASFDAKTTVPYADVVGVTGRALERLEAAPLSAKLVVPNRSLDQVPLVVGLTNVAGSVGAELDVSGTAMTPRAALSVRARGVRATDLPLDLATDSDLEVLYDGERAEIALGVRAADESILDLVSSVDVRARDLLEPSGPELPWRASMRAKLSSFPLQTLGPLSNRGVKGRVSGEIALDDLHRDARARADLTLREVALRGVRYTGGSVHVEAGDGGLNAVARLDQKDGFAVVSATTGLAWGAEVVPSMTESRGLTAHLDARAFRAAALQPFLGGAVNALDGRLNANVDVRLARDPAASTMSGGVTLRDGTAQIAAMGTELRDVRADVKLEPNGTIRVMNASARGASGVVNASAVVRTRGLSLEGATATVQIPKGSPFDFAVQGQPIGSVWGRAELEAKARPEQSRVSVAVRVPELHVELPQVLKTGVQDLGENPNVRVGVYRRPRHFVELPLDREDLEREEPSAEPPTEIALDVHLGKVIVDRGNQLHVEITGEPRVTTDGETQVSGQVRVLRGTLVVQGKQFAIEKGTVTFTGQEPSNPIVVATASWTAADGTKVYADFVGPVKTGDVHLRSEPQLPESEILALVLFGTADGANPAPAPGRAPSGTTQAAVGIGGGFAAQGLTQALDDLAGIHATARIDTTAANNPRPEVEFQLSSTVSVQFAHVLGTPPVTDPDKNLATLDWRFKHNWSLETTFGDRGKTLIDAVWQKRY